MYGWICDFCGFQCKSEEKLDEDVVPWRCEKDWRHLVTRVAKTGKNADLNEKKVTFD